MGGLSALSGNSGMSGMSGRSRSLSPIIIATRANGAQFGNGLSNGTQTLETSRLKHYVTADCSSIVLRYGNFYGANSIGPNSITVKAALEHSSGTITPAYCDGNRTVVIPPGETRDFTVDLARVKGDIIWSRQSVTVASGEKWGRGFDAYAASGAEGGVAANVDNVDSGTVATSPAYFFAPLCVLGVPLVRTPVIAVIGDSIAAGQTGTALLGFVLRAFGSNFGQNFCYNFLPRPGEAAGVWNTTITHRKALVNGSTHAIVDHGINDMAEGISLATLQARIITLWSDLVSRGARRVWQTTITPYTTSTDGWATTANQTLFSAPQNTVRVAYNDWIRDGAPMLSGVAVATGSSATGTIRAGDSGHPLKGYFEVADTVESARNSGLWKASNTTDGLHPNNAGHIAMSAAINTAVLTF